MTERAKIEIAEQLGLLLNMSSRAQSAELGFFWSNGKRDKLAGVLSHGL